MMLSTLHYKAWRAPCKHPHNHLRHMVSRTLYSTSCHTTHTAWLTNFRNHSAVDMTMLPMGDAPIIEKQQSYTPLCPPAAHCSQAVNQCATEKTNPVKKTHCSPLRCCNEVLGQSHHQGQAWTADVTIVPRRTAAAQVSPNCNIMVQISMDISSNCTLTVW
jgi:hypothetical protein